MKYAVLTGGSSTIGRLVANELIKNDFEVALIGRDTQKLKEIGLPYIEADLSNTKNIDTLVNKILEKNKKIDLIANIAGVWHNSDSVFAGVDFEKFEDKTITETMNVGILSPMLLVKKLIPNMATNSLITNLSGTFENGGKGWLPYFVSKRAIEDFTVGLADELREKNIRVCGISPSDTATESYKKFFPQYIEDSLDPREIAKFVTDLYFNSKETGKIFVLKKDTKPFENFHY
ncbi:SDR family oxidoreductase [Candidatus Shapirobacteria bacterium]|nr:SDR family oxidoreductase [Candidatus Shapirobacteria bacterium]